MEHHETRNLQEERVRDLLDRAAGEAQASSDIQVCGLLHALITDAMRELDGDMDSEEADESEAPVTPATLEPAPAAPPPMTPIERPELDGTRAPMTPLPETPTLDGFFYLVKRR